MDYPSSSPDQSVEAPFSGLQPLSSTRMNQSESPGLYDVFINHRGPDVKEIVALPLYKFLRNMGFQVFLDSREIKLGNYFPSTLENAIRSASVHIAIFSKGYAKSAWCLSELDLMLKTSGEIIPVFYDVVPYDLRHSGKGVYKDVFVEYEQKKRYIDKLEKWKIALNKVSFIHGYEFSKNNQDLQVMCEKVASVVLMDKGKVENTRYVAKHSVGLDKLVEDFFSFQRRGDRNIVSIWGLGGCGKTTLAKEVFNRKSSTYDGSCFLSNVKEAAAANELCCLQNKLLNDLFHQNHAKFQSMDEGTLYFQNCMKRGKTLRFLIVLDDIDHSDQLDALLYTHALSSGSLVIVTTRDLGLIRRAKIDFLYHMKLMDREDSKHLFCWYAFGQPYPAPLYEDLVHKFIDTLSGLALILKVLGGHLFGSDRAYWEFVLDKVRRTEQLDMINIIKIVFDSLETEQKQIFMDVACFFIGRPKDMAIRIWKGSGWKAEHALQCLRDRCLVELDDVTSSFKMHDILLNLGRLLADGESHPRRLWRPKLLESLESKGFQNTICEFRGRNIRCLGSMFDRSMHSQITFFFGNTDDCDEKPTALLWLDMCNCGGKFKSLPSWIPLENLQYLKIENAMSSQLEKHNHARDL